MNGKIDIYLKNFAEIAKEYFESEPRNVISQYDNFFKKKKKKNYCFEYVKITKSDVIVAKTIETVLIKGNDSCAQKTAFSGST